MSKLIITRGLPASGKSTWALDLVKNNGNIVRVNRDSIRLMLGSKWNPKHEKLVIKIRNAAIDSALNSGKDVVCDDTNLSEGVVEALRAIAHTGGHEFAVVDSFLDVDVETCLKRDAERQVSVGKDVIMRMYHQMDAPPPAHVPGAPDAIICDLDGTFAMFGDANPYDRDFSQDEPNEAVACILRDWYRVQGRHIIFMSGRDGGRFRNVTMEWLAAQGFDIDKDDDSPMAGGLRLLMRARGDKSGDQFVKAELYVSHVEGKYNVKYVLDDRPKVVRRWRHDFGLTCLQVAPDIDF